MIWFVTVSQNLRRFQPCQSPPKCISRREGGRLNCGLSFVSALPPVQLKTAASRNDPPFKTLGLKLQNNTMTTSVRSRNSICLHLFAACAESVASQAFRSLWALCWSFLSLATSIFAPLRHLTPGLSAEPCCNHIYKFAETRCSPRHLQMSRTGTSENPS